CYNGPAGVALREVDGGHSIVRLGEARVQVAAGTEGVNRLRVAAERLVCVGKVVILQLKGRAANRQFSMRGLLQVVVFFECSSDGARLFEDGGRSLVPVTVAGLACFRVVVDSEVSGDEFARLTRRNGFENLPRNLLLADDTIEVIAVVLLK